MNNNNVEKRLTEPKCVSEQKLICKNEYSAFAERCCPYNGVCDGYVYADCRYYAKDGKGETKQ